MTKPPNRFVRPTDVASSSAEPNTVLVCSGEDPIEVLRLATEENFSQIVQEQSLHHDVEIKSSLVMMDSPPNFFSYPFSTILSPDSVSEATEKSLIKLEIPFSRSDEKDAVMGQVESYLMSSGARAALREDVHLVADELFTNAIYNAGFSLAAVARTEKIVLEPHRECRMMIGADSGRLVLVCLDRFGSLNIPRLLLRIKKCYEKGAGEVMNHGVGGAGIGSYLIFERSLSVYYGVKENHLTLIATVFPNGKSKKVPTAKSIHFVIYDNKDEQNDPV